MGAVTVGGQSDRFGSNFRRLLGLHGLSQNRAAGMLGVSSATMNAWLQGNATPSTPKLLVIREFFEVSGERLLADDFADLLAGEVGDPDRFRRVEERIASHQ